MSAYLIKRDCSAVHRSSALLSRSCLRAASESGAVVLQDFWRSVKVFLWILAASSLIISPVLVSDHF